MISQSNTPLIAKSYTVTRCSVKDPQDTPFNACNTRQVDGNLEQRSSIDQFHDSFRSFAAKYDTPSAMCGYFSVANALLLARELPSRWKVTREELNRTFGVIENASTVVGEAERVMAFLQKSRKAYVEAHDSDFACRGDVAKYLCDWVANYEISDYLVAEAKEGSLLEAVHFFRYNQMPEFETATYEERLRLRDESVFGTSVQAGDKDTAELEAGATRFFVERFLPEHALLRPEHWSEQLTQQDARPPVFVVDVNNHFVVAVPLIIEPSSESQGGPTLLVVDTTKGNSLPNPALVYLFDLAFGERKA